MPILPAPSHTEQHSWTDYIGALNSMERDAEQFAKASKRVNAGPLKTTTAMQTFGVAETQHIQDMLCATWSATSHACTALEGHNAELEQARAPYRALREAERAREEAEWTREDAEQAREDAQRTQEDAARA